MIRSLIYFFIVILSGITIQAQSNIIAIVVESETQEPMQYVNVVLLSAGDSSMVDGMVTDEDGEFDFEDISPGEYRVKISFIGFETVEMFVTAGEGETDLETVPIAKSSILLDEVNITGERSTLTTTVDKKIYNVGKDISSESGSISDILQNVPSVSVDINGKITLRGTSKITFLVNGRPSALLRRNAPIALQQIPASTIDRIEVITNPSAKYDPEGAGGIINIVLRKDSELGINGQVIGSIGNENRYNSTLILNYGTEVFNAIGSYSLTHSSGINVFKDNREKKDIHDESILSNYKENGSTEEDPLGHILNLGVTYQLDHDNTFELAGNYFLQNSIHEGVSNIFETSAQRRILTDYSSNNKNDELESEGEIGAAYEHFFGGNEEHNFVFEAAFASYYEREDLTFREEFVTPAIGNVFKQIFVKKSGEQVELAVEYAQPIDGDSEFEAGYAGEIINDDIFYLNNRILNNFFLNQSIHALYAIYARDIDNFSVELGIRPELVFLNSELVAPNDSLIENDYFELYPSLNLIYEFSDNEIVGLGYSKRVNRPEADQLNPFVEFIDPRNGEGGNANLNPEIIHSGELSYQFFNDEVTFTPTLYYRYKTDAFTQLYKQIGDSLIVSTLENLSSQQAAGLEMIISGKAEDWWNYDLSGNLYYDEIDAINLGFNGNRNKISGTLQLSSLFKLTEKTLLQLNIFYNSPILTPQGQREELLYVNAGLKHMLFNDQLALTFSVSDVFDNYKERITFESSEVNQSTVLRRKDPVFYFGLSWRFGESFNTEESDLKFEETGLRKL